MTQKIRVLVVDDSKLIRDVLTAILNEQPDIEVVGAAADASRRATSSRSSIPTSSRSMSRCPR
jgi:two-component system chemotaxis response regulator CheB